MRYDAFPLGWTYQKTIQIECLPWELETLNLKCFNGAQDKRKQARQILGFTSARLACIATQRNLIHFHFLLLLFLHILLPDGAGSKQAVVGQS